MRLQNPKFSVLNKAFGKQPFRLLDIGAGNSSATKTKSLFPQCEYYGLDISRDYANSDNDFMVMRRFFEIDLTTLQFDELPNDYFDGIWIVHVIEHLHNGDAVIQGLLPKLRRGGYLYVEYPGSKSLKLPSMKGTLNFHDDASHVRLYSVPELRQLFEMNGFEVVSAGTRRSWFYISVIPFRVVFRILRGKAITGNIFWDALGFAEYLFVKKVS
jgi:SAM-dependent methyltransferase